MRLKTWSPKCFANSPMKAAYDAICFAHVECEPTKAHAVLWTYSICLACYASYAAFIGLFATFGFHVFKRISYLGAQPVLFTKLKKWLPFFTRLGNLWSTGMPLSRPCYIPTTSALSTFKWSIRLPRRLPVSAIPFSCRNTVCAHVPAFQWQLLFLFLTIQV